MRQIIEDVKSNDHLEMWRLTRKSENINVQFIPPITPHTFVVFLSRRYSMVINFFIIDFSCRIRISFLTVVIVNFGRDTNQKQ